MGSERLAAGTAGYSRGPMSEYLAAAAAALKVPEAMVLRSASARASANGTTAEEVLKAWAGGTSATVASPAATTVPSPAATSVPAGAVAAPPVVAEATSAAVAAVVPPPVGPFSFAEEVAEPEDHAEPAPPAPLRIRLSVAGRLGASVGALLGLLTVPAASYFLLPLASVTGEPENLSPVVELPSNRFVFGAAAISVVFGATVALVSRRLAAWGGQGMALRGGVAGTVAIGVSAGAVLGLVGAALAIGAFGTEVGEGLVAFPLVTFVAVVAIGGALLGWLTAALIQVAGVPQSVPAGEAAAVTEVRKRLASAASIPVTTLLMLVVLVVPMGLLLVRFHELAPLVAGIAAGGILAFAGLSTSRPGMRISLGEFFAAVVGVGVLVLIVAAVMLAQSENEPVAATPTEAGEG